MSIISFASGILLGISGLIMFAGLITNDLYARSPIFVIATLMLLFSNLLYAFQGNSRKIIFAFLQITIFTFLLGHSTFCYINNDFSNFELSHYELNISNIAIYFCILATRLTIIFITKRGLEPVRQVGADQDSPFMERYKESIRKTSLLFFYFSFCFSIYALFDRVKFVSANSYVEMYTNYSSPLALWASRISNVSNTFLYVFLGTFPTKRECRIPLTIAFLFGVLSLGTQVRNIFVLNTIMLMIYVFMRQQINPAEKWYTKKMLFILPPIIMVVIAFLAFMEYMRAGITTDMTFTSLLETFFIDQGGSIRVIGFSQRYLNELQNISHFFGIGSIIWQIKYSILCKIIWGTVEPATGTVDMALNGGQLSHSLTYLYSPESYGNGYGLGSCYIAEAYVDGGMLCVIAVGIAVGLLIIYSENHLYDKNTPIRFAIIFLLINQIIYLPRAHFGAIISQVFTISNIFCFLLLYFLAKRSSTCK
ncbi:MAG: O-antigen polysaccharide polymerase Wzy family protein [Oscillospiraceae bacterium]|nr:O-antigen polysaccharide polymerase Wzy family protein [Oscillospiraceae bacterium]